MRQKPVAPSMGLSPRGSGRNARTPEKKMLPERRGSATRGFLARGGAQKLAPSVQMRDHDDAFNFAFQIGLQERVIMSEDNGSVRVAPVPSI